MKSNNKVAPLARMHLSLAMVIFLALPAPAADTTQNLTEFSALRVEYNKSFPQKTTHSRIFVSRYGLREEPLDKGGVTVSKGTTIISNAIEKQAWMLVPARKIFIALPSTEEPGVTLIDDAPDDLLSTIPCETYKESRKLGNEKHADRPVEKWQCRHAPTGPATSLLYDPELKVVVRSENSSGHTIELRNIKIEAVARDQFWPPPAFRKVSMKEYFTGIVELPAYQDDIQSAPNQGTRATP